MHGRLLLLLTVAAMVVLIGGCAHRQVVLLVGDLVVPATQLRHRRLPPRWSGSQKFAVSRS